MSTAPRDWWVRGTTVVAAGHQVFAFRRGSGPNLTLLHGYPASSLEWAEVVEPLSIDHSVLALDFLGFGATDKPLVGAIGIDQQADIVEAVWRHFGVKNTSIVAYDYGAIVTQELLARARDGRLVVQIDGVILGNAGLHHLAYRPRPMQRVLSIPVVGDLLGRLVSPVRLHASWGAVFSDEYPLDLPTATHHHEALSHQHGLWAQRRLLGYIAERARRSDRWEGVLDVHAPVTGLLWGMADPVSGEHVLETVRTSLPQARVIELSDGGHCPHIETPDRWSREVRQLLSPVAEDAR